MDIGRSFTYITEDQEWVRKLLIGALITLIPVVGMFYAFGYMIEIIRNTIQGREIPLPDPMEEFGGKIAKGLMMWVISFIYALPIIVLVFCSQTGAVLPAVAQDMDVEILSIIMFSFMGCFGCLTLLYGIFMSLITPYAFAMYAESGQFGDAFKFAKIFDMLKKNLGPTFIALLIIWLVSFVASLVGTIACGIGLIFAIFYAQMVMGFLYGSLYKQARGTVY